MRKPTLVAVLTILPALLWLLGAPPALAKKPRPHRSAPVPAATTPAPDAPPPGAPAITPIGAPVAAPAAKLPVAEEVARMQRFYETTTDLHAHFDQEMQNPMRGTKKLSGEVWLKKPGRMRWDYQKPEKKLMIADGTALWIFEPEDEQAIRQPLKDSTLPTSVTFLFGTGRLTDEFDVTEGGAPGVTAPAGDVVLKLVPKKPTAQYRYLVFVVDGRSFMVKESYIYDQQDGTNHMRFHDVETNKGVGNAKFEFSPPPGTKIIHP